VGKAQESEMDRTTIIAAVAASFALAACASQRNTEGPLAGEPLGPSTAAADIMNASGRTVARVTAEEAGEGVRLRIEAEGMPTGAYGAHVHTIGRCDAPAFTTAGPHWNPSGRLHGKDNPAGMHKGDLPNLLVGTDGRGSFEYTVLGAAIGGPGGMLDADGAAVVIHQRPDDYRTDPSGNSGDRIACGVLR
jgi:Cu-Zn family superoxide dismutase